MNKTFLETQRLRLTEISQDDLPLLIDLDSDPEVMKFITNGKTTSPQEAEIIVERIMKLSEKFDHKFGIWNAFTKDSNDFIGWFLFRPCKKNPENLQKIELGYRLKRKFWGQGYASEASRSLLSLGFDTYHLKSIFAVAMKGNKASQNVMIKIGMKHVADFQETDFPGPDKLAARYEIRDDEYKFQQLNNSSPV